MTPERYTAARHVVVSRRGQFTGPVDDALEALGLTREIVAVVPGFPDALRIARQSDLVALVTQSCLSDPQFEEGLVSFPYRWKHRRSPSSRSGIPARKPTLRIAGCAKQLCPFAGPPSFR